MNRVDKSKFIQNLLNELYPDPPIPLIHTNNFTLLVAVVLSAQSTDKKVNELTKDLFNIAPNAKSMVSISESGIYNHIKYLGLARKKSKNIYLLSKRIIEDFKGEIPSNFKDLESLPGVGHKTASVVMAQAFGIPTFPVDTHIHRLAQRWGLTSGLNVKTTEKDLKTIFPKTTWNKLHLQIIFYGREFCTARGCDGTKCTICKSLYPKRIKPVIHKKA